MVFKEKENYEDAVAVKEIKNVRIRKYQHMNEYYFNVSVYLDKNCNPTFDFPTFELAKRFYNIITSSFDEYFIHLVRIYNELIREYNSNGHKEVFYKTN